jgi:hypothetical protein
MRGSSPSKVVNCCLLYRARSDSFKRRWIMSMWQLLSSVMFVDHVHKNRLSTHPQYIFLKVFWDLNLSKTLLTPISAQEKFPRTEDFPKISLLKVRKFSSSKFFRRKIRVGQITFYKFFWVEIWFCMCVNHKQFCACLDSDVNQTTLDWSGYNYFKNTRTEFRRFERMPFVEKLVADKGPSLLVEVFLVLFKIIIII